jgi:hypothetical protein
MINLVKDLMPSDKTANKQSERNCVGDGSSPLLSRKSRKADYEAPDGCYKRSQQGEEAPVSKTFKVV